MEKKKSKKSVYIIIGIAFIIIAFLIAMFVFSKSYALEGFGQLNLSCDKTIGVGGENIQCTLTGTVASTSQVSSLSSQIELSDNLEFVSFTTDTIWEGDGNEGNIQLYTEENKTSTFAIGTFMVKIKEGITNTTESIKLNDNYFYDEAFEEQTIEDTSVEIKTPQYHSDVYDIKEDYIIVNTKDIASILANVKTEGCTSIIEINEQSVITGTISDNSVLKIMNGNDVLKELSIIYINSTKYDLSKGYILSSENDLNKVKDNVEVINGSLSVKNGQLVLSYNNTGVLSYDILNITSSTYFIDLSKNYILVDEKIEENNLENISKTDNISLDYDGHKLDIIYQEEVVRTLFVANVYSEKYDMDVMNGYIYVGSTKISNDIISNINSNVELTVKDNQLIISNGGEQLVGLDIVNIYSDTYKINDKEQYIYTKNTNQIDTIKENVEITNGNISIESNKLSLIYKEKTIEDFNLYYLSSTESKIDDNTIYIHGEMEYTTFIQSLTFNGLSYHIYNTTNEEVTSGTVSDNCSIKLYIGDTLVDTYNIKTEYLDIKDLKVNEEEKIIYHISLNTTYNDIIKNIDTSGTIEIHDNSGKKLQLDSKVKSYSIITIKLSSETVEYKVSVLGDATGTGSVTVGDIAKLFQYVKGKKELDTIAILSGDVTGDGKVLINDIGKAYSYLKGKRESLD